MVPKITDEPELVQQDKIGGLEKKKPNPQGPIGGDAPHGMGYSYTFDDIKNVFKLFSQ